MKTEVDKLDVTPSKRIYLSIIADYDLNKAICELVDNGIDIWIREGKRRVINIEIFLDRDQQIIVVKDDAGGLQRSELRNIIGPGVTGTNPSDETIGIFGVGTKRAVVALAQDIKIKTRYRNQKTFQIDLDDHWLGSDDWNIPVYEVDNIGEGSTIIELQRLRSKITEDNCNGLCEYLGATYSKFLQGKINITVDRKKITPIYFDNWAYPPKFEPRKFTGNVQTNDNRIVKVDSLAGLINESSPASGEYGVYIYCNDRLIARALKSPDVGFIKGYAGLPHPKVSLTRVIISLNGDARDMPWNSDKSDVNPRHEVFHVLHDWLFQVVSDYAALSRNWMGEWPEKVFKYNSGIIQDVEIINFPEAKKSFLPPLPKSRLRYSEEMQIKNRLVVNDKPWTKGLYEGIVAADLIQNQQNLEQRNRLALIILDSTLEIAFKEYLVNDSKNYYSDSQLLTIFAKRHLVHQEMKKYLTVDNKVWDKITYYNNQRNKLIHERATATISKDDLRDFRKVVEEILNKLYKLRFK